jgi:hypothetical protein
MHSLKWESAAAWGRGGRVLVSDQPPWDPWQQQGQQYPPQQPYGQQLYPPEQP